MPAVSPAGVADRVDYKMNPRILACCLSAAAALSAGCSRDPMESRISARDYINYSMWLNDVDPGLTDEQRQELKDAEAEIKLDIQIHSDLGFSDEINGIFFQRIDGHTLREYLVDGLTCRIGRLETESKAYGALIDADERIGRESGQEGSDDYRYLMKEIEAKHSALQKDQDQIQAARLALKGLVAKAP